MVNFSVRLTQWRICAERARRAAALIEPGQFDRAGSGKAVLLWRDEHSEAWLNLWWQSRDTGYHDHSGSCVGVHVITRPRLARADHPGHAACGASVWPR
jgi:hypothetical protein